jgi:hypothetical protein
MWELNNKARKEGAVRVRQAEIYATEPLVLQPTNSEVEISIANFKKYKSPGSDQILLKHYGLKSILINSIWSKEELPDQKESIIVPIHKKGDKTDCSNYREISLLTTSYKILSNILLSRLSPYVDEIIGDQQCGFRQYISYS